MWDAVDGATARDATDATIHQGYLEMSNTSVVKEMVNIQLEQNIFVDMGLCVDDGTAAGAISCCMGRDRVIIQEPVRNSALNGF